MKSQNQRVLERLLEGKELTNIDGYSKFNPPITRIAARVADLNNDNIPVMTDKWGGTGKSQYKIYYLTKEFIKNYKSQL